VRMYNLDNVKAVAEVSTPDWNNLCLTTLTTSFQTIAGAL